MIINLKKFLDEFKINLKGIVHVGACLGEEWPIYKEFTDRVVWIEANPHLIPTIKQNVPHYQPILNYAICDVDDETRKFNLIYSDDRTNPGCSSLLELKEHAYYYPMIKKVEEIQVKTKTLDSLLKKNWISTHNMLNLDIQGAELLALKGGVEFLKGLDIIYTEFAVKELYEGCCQLRDLNKFLAYQGFKQYDIEFAHPTWGDVIYVRDSAFNN